MRSKLSLRMASTFASTSSAAVTSTATPQAWWNFSSWRNITVSLPILRAFSPAPMVTSFCGGWLAAPSWSLDWSLTCGQASRAVCLDATFMAKARQVGTPQSPQLVRGSSLKMSSPVKAIVRVPPVGL